MMNTTRTVLLRAAPLCVLWWIVTDGAGESWGFGAPTIILAVIASLRLSPSMNRGFSFAGACAFAAFFLASSLRAGVQVAMIALRPRLVLAPAVLRIPVHLEGDLERAILSATLNLLPGTLVAGGDRSHVQVHVLDARAPIEAEVRAVEGRVARIFNAVPA